VIREPYASWPLAQLPSPILLHPVAYQVGGHDIGDPDFLPGDPRWGSLATLVADAHAHGDLLMPYDNLSWWDPSSSTMQSTTAQAVGALDHTGAPQAIDYGTHGGVIVSPASADRASVTDVGTSWSDTLIAIHDSIEPPTFVHDLASRLRCRKCAKVGRRPAATLLQLAWQPRHPRTEA